MDAFCYFIDHASSDLELLLGTINFLVIFILLPLVPLALFLFVYIKSGIKSHKEILKKLQEIDEKEKENS